LSGILTVTCKHLSNCRKFTPRSGKHQTSATRYSLMKMSPHNSGLQEKMKQLLLVKLKW